MKVRSGHRSEFSNLFIYFFYFIIIFFLLFAKSHYLHYLQYGLNISLDNTVFYLQYMLTGYLRY